MVAARYWRLRVVDVTPSNAASKYVRIANVAFAGEYGGPDLTTPAEASTRAIYSAGTTSGVNAFDNSTSSYWDTGNILAETRWVGWDFGTPTEIKEMRFIDVGTASRRLTNLRVEYSDDGLAWNVAWIWTGLAVAAQTMVCRDDAVPLNLTTGTNVYIGGASAYNKQASAASLTVGVINVGGTVAANDLILAFIMHRSAITSVPAGWTLVATEDTYSNTLALQAVSIYSRRATSNGENTSGTWQQASAGRFIGFQIAYRSGVGGYVDIDYESVTSASLDNINAQAISAPATSTPNDDAIGLVVASAINIPTSNNWGYSGGAATQNWSPQLPQDDNRLTFAHTIFANRLIPDTPVTLGAAYISSDFATLGGMTAIAMALYIAGGTFTKSVDFKWNVAEAADPFAATILTTEWNIAGAVVPEFTKQLQFFWEIEEQPYTPGSAYAPHWRLTFTETVGSPDEDSGAYWVNISELTFETSFGSGQLAIGGTATSAPIYEDHTPDLAFDGINNTYWESDENPLDGSNYLAYEFPTPVTVGSITVFCAANTNWDECPTKGEVQYSYDGVNWFFGWPYELSFEYGPVTPIDQTSSDQGSTVGPLIAAFNTTWMLGDFSGTFTVDFVTEWNVLTKIDTSRLIVPDMPVTELWTFQTSIFRSRNGREERRARILRPVISLQYTAPSFEPADFWATRRTLEIDTNEFYPVPLYQYYAYLDAPAHIGDTRLYFSQVRTNVVNSQYVAIIKDGEEPIVQRVRDIHADGVTLLFPLEVDLDRLYMVCPVIMSRLGADASTKHSTVYAYTTFSFVSADRTLDFTRPGNSVALPMLDDLPILSQYIRANDDISEMLVSGNTVIDNARANPVMFVNEGTRRQFDLVYKIARSAFPDEMDFWRAFFEYVRGSQKAFAVPTFRPDGEVRGILAGGETEITLEGPDFHDVWARGGYVGLALGYGKDFVVETCRVSAVTVVNGHSVCELTAPIVGSGYDTVSFIMSVRCASDQITLEHHEDETLISFSVISVRV